MNVTVKGCFVLLILSAFVTVIMCEEGQGPDCGLGIEVPTREEVMVMVKNGYIRSLKVKNEDKTTEPRIATSFGSYVRRRRSIHYGFSPFHHDPPCPVQTDQSLPYSLGSDPTGYPADVIAAELFQRSLPGSDLLFQCLARSVIDPDKGPVVDQQPFLEKGTTCPQSFRQLWTYNSLQYGNKLCWALTNFQEDIMYAADCLGKPCLGCSSMDVPFSFDLSITYQKQCLPRFATVSLWAFCPGLPDNQRIVRDRIVLPVDCSCTTVSCQKSQRHH